jgi:hypothetical protein
MAVHIKLPEFVASAASLLFFSEGVFGKRAMAGIPKSIARPTSLTH